MLFGNFNMEFMPKKEFPISIIFAGIAVVGLAGPTAAEVHGFRDDFERENVGDAWTSHANSFSIRNGVLVASQLPDAGHGAVTRAQLNFRDAAIDFSFKYDGGERFNFVVDDKNCKEVHAGHICRVSFRKNGFTIQDDRTGVMNLEIRGSRDDPIHRDRIATLLETKKLTVEMEFVEGVWYHARIVMEGDGMRVFLNGILAGELISEGIGHPTKTQFGFTTTGRDILFDNVKALGSW
tara:strand:- start:34 stop:744 length:711 start_codon:yes stop_codon:yes gene_type:complete